MKRPDSVAIPRELTVGQVATRSDVAISTLHFYESQGLIRSWRNRGNQRRYAREVLRRVAIIKVAQRTGIPLASIRRALKALPGERTPTADDWRKMSATWRAELDDRIARLTRLRPVEWLHRIWLFVPGRLPFAQSLGQTCGAGSGTAVAGPAVNATGVVVGADPPRKSKRVELLPGVT